MFLPIGIKTAILLTKSGGHATSGVALLRFGPRSGRCSGKLLARAQADGLSVSSSWKTSSCEQGQPPVAALHAQTSTLGVEVLKSRVVKGDLLEQLLVRNHVAPAVSKDPPQVLCPEGVETGPLGSGQCPGLATIEQDREHQPPEDLDLSPSGEVLQTPVLIPQRQRGTPGETKAMFNLNRDRAVV